jgi:hypothetical protein
MPEYRVRQGECILSIAEKTGFFWRDIWEHPENNGLRKRKREPGTLHPGDVVYIPEHRIKYENGATDQLHRFRKRGTPARVRLRLMENDKPRAGEHYLLDVDGALFQGTTDNDGIIECSIAPDAKEARLVLDEDEEYVFELGCLDPVSETTGQQARLEQLGFTCGAAEGDVGLQSEDAVRNFQHTQRLHESGRLDDKTEDEILKCHDSQ